MTSAAEILPCSSSTIFSAVFLPKPLAFESFFTSASIIASAASSADMEVNTPIALFGPTPDTDVSRANSSFSFGESKPNSVMPSSLTCMETYSSISAPKRALENTLAEQYNS